MAKKKNVFQVVGGFIGGFFSKKKLKQTFLVPILGIGITVSVIFNDGKPSIDIDVQTVTPEQVQEIKKNDDAIIIE